MAKKGTTDTPSKKGNLTIGQQNNSKEWNAKQEQHHRTHISVKRFLKNLNMIRTQKALEEKPKARKVDISSRIHQIFIYFPNVSTELSY